MDDQIAINSKNTHDITANVLKIIAIIAMFGDHFFAIALPHDTVIGTISRITGRIVAPIFCYLVAEGYYNTSNIKKYIFRLLIFAVISHFPYVMYFQVPWWKATSVFWGLALGLIALTAVKSDKLDTWKKILAVGVCCILAYPADWNYIGVLWIVCFGVFRGQFKAQMTALLVIGYFFVAIPFLLDWDWAHFYQFAIALAIPLLALYKGRQGKKSKALKWGFYIFYPAHLILLFLLLRLYFKM